MFALDEATITRLAPNADALKNGRGLVLKNNFVELHHDADGTILFGACQGSGKTPYQCSADFALPEQPTFRCTCPSRQFPCKHGLGLLFAYVLKKSFTAAEVPADLAAKREKLTEKKEKAKEPAKPKTVNKGALAKKIQAQLNGLDVLETLAHDLMRHGLGNMNAKLARETEEQAKQLGDAYLPGAQAALHDYTRLFYGDNGKFTDLAARERERIASDALDQLSRLKAIAKQGRVYLQNRLDDPDLKPDTESGIAAWLGHAWQLTELKAAGLVEDNAELLQLAFHTYDDAARREYVDIGVWIDLKSGRVRRTQKYRPYKAAKLIASDDSVFDVMQVPELYIYPGDANPRIRWDGLTTRPATPQDFETVRGQASKDFTATIKEVKGRLKAPLADKQPIHLLHAAKLGQVGSEFVIEDAKGERLVLTDAGWSEEPPTCHLLSYLPGDCFADCAVAVRFHHNLDAGTLRVKPLSFVRKSGVLRLTF